MDLFYEKIQKFDKSVNLKNVIKFYYKDYLIGYINSLKLINLLVDSYGDYFLFKNNILVLNYCGVESECLTDLFDRVLIDIKEIFGLKIFNEQFGVHPIIESKLISILNMDENFEYPMDVLFKVDRCLIPLFGFLGFGVHLNGYVFDSKNFEMWISLRDKTKITFPLMYDNLVGGGVSFGWNFFDTLIKEAEEEASIPFDLIKNAKKIGAIHYVYNLANIEDSNFKNKNELGVRNDLLIVYQLDVLNFIPKINDGEVSSFTKITMDKLYQKMVNENDIKFNSMLTMVLFMLKNKISLFSIIEKNIIDKYLM